MGKRGGQKRGGNGGATNNCLRVEASGKKQSHNPKLLLKLKHLQNLAEWATKDASIPSLGAFFGCQFAEFGQNLGIRPDPSLVPCQRCEILLQPGFNCTVRIEKNRAKRRHRRGKPNTPTQNNVVYTCNLCSHRNLKRGTQKGHMTQLCPKPSLPPKLKSETPTAQKSNPEKEAPTPTPATGNIVNNVNDGEPASAPKLLDSNRSKRKKARPNQSLVGSAPPDVKIASDTSTSRKRKKPWTTLAEIAKNEEAERDQRFKKHPVPFRL